MPLRGGESVGRAYVRIYADGSEVPGDIRRAIEEAEPSVREAAREQGRTYGEEFDKESRKTFKTRFGKTKKEMFEDLNKGLTESLAQLELSERFFNGKEWKQFIRRLGDEFGDAGKLAARRLEADFRDSGDLRGLQTRMKQIGVEVRRSQSEILASLHDEALRMNKAFDRALIEEDGRRNLALRKQQQDALKAVVLFKNNMKDVFEQVERLEQGERTIKRSRLREMLDDLRKIAPSAASSSHELLQFNHAIEEHEKRLRRANPHLSVFDNRLRRIGDGMGRLFGKGSRNDFLNFFGSFVGLLAQTPRLLTTFASKITELSAAFGESFVTGLKETAVFGLKAAGSIAAFAGFIAILGAVLGPVIGLLSGLVAIITALASSLVYAAIGALAGFLPLLVGAGGLVAGVIAYVQAIKDASEQTPKLKRAISEVRDEASKLWDTFKDEALQSLPLVLRRASNVLREMTPFVDSLGDGFDRFIRKVSNALDSPAFDHFFKRFSQFLPHAMEDLGTIVGNVAQGLAGIFTGTIPLSNRLLDWLVKITDEFAKWAGSREGRKEIKDFLEQAGDSAKSVGDFLEGAWNWLTQLISKSKGEGDTLWERIGGKFQEWADWIKDNPDAFSNWMKDADDLAGDIGDLVDNLNELIDDLDSPENRKAGRGIIKAINSIVDAMDTLLTMFNITTPLSALLTHWDAVASWFEGFKDRLDQLGSDIWYVIGGAWVGDLFHGIETALRGAGGWLSGIFSDFWDNVRGAFSGKGGSGGMGALAIKPSFDPSGIAAGISKLPGMAQKAVEGFRNKWNGLGQKVAHAAGDIRGALMGRFDGLAAKVGNVVDQVVSRWGNARERIARTLGDVWSKISEKFTSIPGNVGEVVTQIVGKFTGLAGRILSAIGPINIFIGITGPGAGLLGGHGSAVKGPGRARGGIAYGEQQYTIGEAGPEAVVPLNRPLSQVDPAVRWLSAIAQGLPMAAGGIMGGERTVVDASNWQIITPSEDPRIVATAVVNELVAKVG